MKKILIIDNMFEPPHAHVEIRELVLGSAGGLGPVEISVARGPDENIPADLAGFDGVVISGSEAAAEQDAPWVEKQMTAIRQLHSRKIPTLGICYGEQLIARTFGGAVGKAESYEYGWVEIEASSSPLFSGLPRKFFSFGFHHDEVRTLPANFTLTASSEDCAVQAYDLKDAPMWGVQFHPDYGSAYCAKLVDGWKGGPNNVRNADRGEQLFDPRVGDTIFRNFLRQVWDRR